MNLAAKNQLVGLSPLIALLLLFSHSHDVKLVGLALAVLSAAAYTLYVAFSSKPGELIGSKVQVLIASGCVIAGALLIGLHYLSHVPYADDVGYLVLVFGQLGTLSLQWLWRVGDYQPQEQTK
jgi:threonine/homoserine efflux transporter RhtA